MCEERVDDSEINETFVRVEVFGGRIGVGSHLKGTLSTITFFR